MDAFEQTGRLWLRGIAPEPELKAIDSLLGKDVGVGTRTTTNDLKMLLPRTFSVIDEVTSNARPVRSVFFRKTPASNWGVPWHQDRVIALNARHEIDGFANWSQKQGVWHCEPPVHLLEQMFFLRVHLDDQGESNGAMQIAQGTHRLGKILTADAETVANSAQIEMCEAKRGDVLLLKMLVLHSSKPAILPDERRALRVDLAAFELPHPLDWQ